MNKLGNDEYFELTYRETFGKLSRYVLLKSPGPADAEDVVANVYTDFYRLVALKERRPIRVLAYLVRMANHELSKFYTGRDGAISLDNDDSGVGDSLVADTDIEEEYFDRYDGEQLWAAVRMLSDKQQKILALRYKYDMTFAQIAHEMRIKESTAKLSCYRSLEKLKKILE